MQRTLIFMLAGTANTLTASGKLAARQVSAALEPYEAEVRLALSVYIKGLVAVSAFIL